MKYLGTRVRSPNHGERGHRGFSWSSRTLRVQASIMTSFADGAQYLSFLLCGVRAKAPCPRPWASMRRGLCSRALLMMQAKDEYWFD